MNVELRLVPNPDRPALQAAPTAAAASGRAVRSSAALSSPISAVSRDATAAPFFAARSVARPPIRFGRPPRSRPAEPAATARRGESAAQTRRGALRELQADERGAVTAEYAIVIMAAVAFAGLLVAIMRSSEIRAMLVQLVENALGSAG